MRTVRVDLYDRVGGGGNHRREKLRRGRQRGGMDVLHSSRFILNVVWRRRGARPCGAYLRTGDAANVCSIVRGRGRELSDVRDRHAPAHFPAACRRLRLVRPRSLSSVAGLNPLLSPHLCRTSGIKFRKDATPGMTRIWFEHQRLQLSARCKGVGNGWRAGVLPAAYLISRATAIPST